MKKKEAEKIAEMAKTMKSGAEVVSIRTEGNAAVAVYSSGETRSVDMTDNPCAASAIELFALTI